MLNDLPQEYVDFLERNLSLFERLGDAFSGSDERLDYAVKQLVRIQARLTELPTTIENLGVFVNMLKEYLTMPKITTQVILRQNLAPLQGIRLQDFVPIDGKITSIAFHFPLGCASLVDIAFGYEARQMMPYSGFLALDDATPVFPADEVVERNKIVWAVMQNTDMFAHDVSVIITISGEVVQ